jgi:hypothetical protein
MEVLGRDSIVCPIPTLLIRRFTEGVYYDLCSDPAFGNPFGESFQMYAGEVIQRANTRSRYRVWGEEEYLVGRNKKRTVDWIVSDDSGALLVETKTKRLLLRAKTDITSAEILAEELDKMAGFVVQVYKTMADCHAGRYPSFARSGGQKFYPVILTLEDWYAFGPMIVKQLEDRVRSRLNDAGMSGTCVDDAPFSTCSISDFEILMQVIAQHRIVTVLQEKTIDPEPRQWAMCAFLQSRYNSDEFRRNLFLDVFNSITAHIPDIDGPNTSSV